MNPLESALRSLVEFLEREGVPYMVIGGLAGLVWGVRRATFDVDLTVWALDREGDIVRGLCEAFSSRVPDPQAFVRDASILPMEVNGTRADIVFGKLPYEEAAIRRAPEVALADIKVRVCAPEDLIVHKIISDRPKDQEDVRELIGLRGKALDRAYLDPLIRSLASDLGRRALWENYLSCFRT